MSQHPAPPAPPAPRWLRPAVRVRLRSGVVCVEQRVPARVAEIRFRLDRIGEHRAGSGRPVPFYESGLGGSPTPLRLVRERLTVPLAAVGTVEEARRAVRAALAEDRRAGGGPLPAAPSPGDLFGHLVSALAAVGVAAGVYWFAVTAGRELLGSGGDRFFEVFMAVLVSLIVVGTTAIVLALARRAWVLRTPSWLAEDQWRLLRRTLAGLARQEPGSSRPLDVEAGLRRDLLTHPGGERMVRGLTRDGLPGPAWPDRIDVARAVRRARRVTAGLGVVLVLGLAAAGAALMLPVSLGLFSPVPLPALAYGVCGAFVCARRQDSDALILSRPARAPGDRGPVEITPDRVDAPSLPSWCEARRREDRWSALTAVHIGLVAAVLVAQAAVAAVFHGDSLVAGGDGIGPVAAVAPLVVFALGGAAGARWSARQVRLRDERRRACAGAA